MVDGGGRNDPALPGFGSGQVFRVFVHGFQKFNQIRQVNPMCGAVQGAVLYLSGRLDNKHGRIGDTAMFMRIKKMI